MRPEVRKRTGLAHGYIRGMLLPSAYFPPISWVSHHLAGHAVAPTGRFVRQTIRNRCIILGANGPMQLGVPLKRFHNHSDIGEIIVDDSQPWRMRHWRALTSAYRNSPYFEFFEDEIRSVILPQEPQQHLADLNAQSLAAVLRLMALRPVAQTNLHQTQINPWDRQDRPFADPLRLLPYRQVWADRFPFEPDLSVLDLLFCTGRQYAGHLLPMGH